MSSLYSNLSLANRLMTGVGAVFLMALGVVTWVSISNMDQLIIQAEERELADHLTAVHKAIHAEERLAEALAVLVANSPAAQVAMANDDRAGLQTQFEQAYAVLKKQYGARQFQFHTPPAISYLRVHKPEKFGDDLSSFRKTVVETNTRKEPITGLEAGVAGIGVRGVVPIFYEGKHLGSVEFGMAFGQTFFDEFKQEHDIDVALYLPDPNGYRTFASTFGEQPLLSREILDGALQGERQIGYRGLNGVPHAVLAAPIEDFSSAPLGVVEIALDRSHYLATSANARNMGLLTGVIAFILGQLVAWSLARTVVGPLRNVITEMGRIANGDLSGHIKSHCGSEIGRLNEGLNSMLEKMRNLMERINHAAAKLDTATTEVSHVAEESRDGMARQQRDTDQVVAAMSEMRATVDDVARNAAAGAESARQADEAADGGRRVVNETVTVINELAGEVDEAAAVIGHLKERSENIGKVLEVIKEIADQTNLLALNAAIEAARAGEQGRGFAVVADEVRTLASRTTDSTTEIQRIIEELQTGAENAVDVMARGREKAHRGVEKAAEAGESLTRITTAVTHISDLSTQIASAAEQQAAVVHEINNNIEAIYNVTQKTTLGAQQTAQSSEQLEELVHSLKNQLGQFKLH